MKSLLLVVTLYGALTHALPIISEPEEVTEKDEQLAKEYLERFYPEPETTPVLRGRGGGISADKIRQMQKFAGLQVTGKLDSSTLDVMKKPRCGVPDVGRFTFFPLVKEMPKKNNLTYWIQNHTPDMNSDDIDEAIKKAWKLWSDVTPLTFTRVYNNPADIVISFAAGDHGDWYPFDGPGNVFAHAFSPVHGGAVHFDEDEKWTKDLQGINLFVVAAHEFGHSLGLDHSENYEALMHSTYKMQDPANLRLHQDDIDGIQALYGHPQLQPANVPPEASSTDLCSPHLTFDAVVTLRGETMFFKDSFFWRNQPLTKEIERVPISAFWPVFSSSLDAAYEVEQKDLVFLFKGQNYWASRANEIQPGFPQNIHTLGLPNSVNKIDAAVYDKNSRKTWFFSGDKYWRYDETNHSMDRGYPRKIAVDFHEIGSRVDAAFAHNGHFYLFRGSTRYEFDSKTQRFIGMEKSNSWFDCN